MVVMEVVVAVMVAVMVVAVVGDIMENITLLGTTTLCWENTDMDIC